MKLWTIVLIVAVVGFQQTIAECPPGQYNPGPDCSFEVICGLPSAHSARSHYCDCWCNHGTIRDSQTMECVKKCPRLKSPYA
ncbi:hypothetical protein PYW07_015528 [Mythimna separata]|uniref:TIL domain-containing protein n=1 Tax=Mythimna separata TaxID=271217 RepID=A0AAD7YYP2_MYTSE|nr:hypothetical protein PYW07_015528 [Mythimna separata]